MNSTRQRKIKELNSHYIEQQEIVLKQKTKSKKGLIRRLSFLGVFMVLIISGTAFTLHAQNKILNNKIAISQQLEAEYAHVQDVEKDLRDEIKNLNNLEYISEIVRRDYYLTKPGEIIFKVTPTTSD